jgi:phosphatidylglycerophosphate synthase
VRISWKDFTKQARRTYKLGIRQRMLGEGAMPLSWLLAHTPITPNQVTIGWGLIQLISPFLMLRGDYWSILTGLTIYQFAIFLDVVDGHLARFKKIQSFAGLYFDQIAHYLTIPLMIFCLGFGLSKYNNTTLYLIIGILTVIFFIYSKLLTFNPNLYGISNVKEVNTMFSTSASSFRSSKSKIIIVIFEWLRIEHPFNALWFFVLFGFGHIGLALHMIVYLFELIRKVVSQTRQLNKIDKNLDYTSH